MQSIILHRILLLWPFKVLCRLLFWIIEFSSVYFMPSVRQHLLARHRPWGVSVFLAISATCGVGFLCSQVTRQQEERRQSPPSAVSRAGGSLRSAAGSQGAPPCSTSFLSTHQSLMLSQTKWCLDIYLYIVGLNKYLTIRLSQEKRQTLSFWNVCVCA